ncbi:MAG: tRNA epoxyqueuosine(34) reductase QueG [Gammaproteobacteria bacterium]|nr:tRNA epoxyqueuosine(34) reductase QueG [Gammaproteobacteria bacterium]
MANKLSAEQLIQLKTDLAERALELGFDMFGISDTSLEQTGQQHQQWLARHFHGDMDYMHKHGSKRWRPAELVPGTLSVISVAMNYQPDARAADEVLTDNSLAYISRYALGRDYHKLVRNRLQKLAKFAEQQAGPYGYRVFCDSAPIMEKPLAAKAGIGWTGKHSNLLNRQHGSWFFLGEIYTDMELPADAAVTGHCGNCTSCIDACPTAAIVEPYVVDARLCISYLTIEYKGSIPESLRPLVGNRIYGCDDCQLVCPWNRFAGTSPEADFKPRHNLDNISLLELFSWNEAKFLSRTEGSAIRRIGYEQWKRNIAIALGNGDYNPETVQALRTCISDSGSRLVAEHCQWALDRLAGKQ